MLRNIACAFGSERTVLLDAHYMTTQPGSPRPFDGHHYQTDLSAMYTRLVAMVASHFFSSDKQSPTLPFECSVGVDTKGIKQLGAVNLRNLTYLARLWCVAQR